MGIKTLYIVRHAKSSWKEPGLSDHERPLNKRGKRDAPFMAEFISKRISSGDGTGNIGLVSSTAVRAFSTAKEFAKAMGIDKKDIIQEDDLYMADEGEILDLIKTAADKFDTLFIFGHNPGLTYAVNRLSNSNIENIPTCGVVCITFESDSWKDAVRLGRIGKGELKFFEYPKKYYKDPLSE